ncbi:MAG TPA: cytochrome c [Candidatus Acidoferrum sp.]|nr:cytochrome c [Candidatus Acidoferrum sp.]
MTHRPMIVSLLVGLGLAAPLAARASDNLVAGRELATAYCARCHAISGEGPSPVAKAPPFARLHKTQPPEDLTMVFEGGHLKQHEAVEMPQFALTQEQIDDLLAYIRSLP